MLIQQIRWSVRRKIVNIEYLCYRDVSYRLHCISVHRSYHLFSNKRNKYLDDIKQFLKKAGKSVGCFFHTTFSIMEDSIFSCIPKENYPLITRHWWPSHVKIYMYICICKNIYVSENNDAHEFIALQVTLSACYRAHHIWNTECVKYQLLHTTFQKTVTQSRPSIAIQ